jgi:hypothetical protein
MTTIPIFRMSAPSFNAERVKTMARALGVDADTTTSAAGTVAHSDRHVLTAASPCSHEPGLVLYIDRDHSLGRIYETPLPPEEATKHAMELLSGLDLLPLAGGEGNGKGRLVAEPEATVAEAVVFDGKERRRVPARTDFRLRLSLDGIPVNGPRTRVRVAYGTEPRPILVYRSLWDRLELHDEVELVGEHEVLTALDKSMRRRDDHVGRRTLHVHSVRLVYMADEYRGQPDLLTPTYLVEIEGPGQPGTTASAGGPRQLLRLPAWRTPVKRDTRPPVPVPA